MWVFSSDWNCFLFLVISTTPLLPIHNLKNRYIYTTETTGAPSQLWRAAAPWHLPSSWKRWRRLHRLTWLSEQRRWGIWMKLVLWRWMIDVQKIITANYFWVASCWWLKMLVHSNWFTDVWNCILFHLCFFARLFFFPARYGSRPLVVF